MPTVLRIGPYRFFFYSYDLAERPHIHVIRDCNEAKFWLDDGSLARNDGLSARDVQEIHRLVLEYKEILTYEWENRQTRR